jgi:hypothetical protein
MNGYQNWWPFFFALTFALVSGGAAMPVALKCKPQEHLIPQFSILTGDES